MGSRGSQVSRQLRFLQQSSHPELTSAPRVSAEFTIAINTRWATDVEEVAQSDARSMRRCHVAGYYGMNPMQYNDNGQKPKTLLRMMRPA
jgi:hypothetical protein